MRPTLCVRRATAPLYSAARTGSASTSRAPSTAAAAEEPNPAAPRPSASAPFLPDGQASASTLRTLVSLHHAASTFMHTPAEVPTAFATAVLGPELRDSPAVRFEPYAAFERAARARAAERPHGGLAALRPVGSGGNGVRLPAAPRAGHMGAEAARDVWRRRGAPAFSGAAAQPPALTEREMAVREALFGTWERAGQLEVVPSLEGVMDVLEAAGSTVRQSADEWRLRDAEAIGKGETEDGM